MCRFPSLIGWPGHRPEFEQGITGREEVRNSFERAKRQSVLDPRLMARSGKSLGIALSLRLNLFPPVAALGKSERVVDIPRSLGRFIWQTSGHHQIWLAVMSAIVFGLTTVPLEIQRRVVND